MKTLIAVLLGALPVLAIAQVEIEKPWVRATPPGAKLGAAYFVIRNKGSSPDRLLGGSTTAAGRVETHITEHEGGVYRMRPVDGYDVPAGGRYELKPAGPHLMLMDLKQPLKEGEHVSLVLRFQKAGDVKVDAPVLRMVPREGHRSH